MRAPTRHAARRGVRPFCYYEAAINLLTNAALDPFGKIPEFKYCAVRVRGRCRAGGAGAGRGALRRLSQRTLLLALSVVLGAVRAFQMPAQQALVPLLVPPMLLPRAMAFSQPGCRAPSSPGRRWAASSTWPARRWSTACARAVRAGLGALPAHPPRRPAAGRAAEPGHAAGRRALRAAEQGGAGRHLAGPVRGAAGRRGGAAADVSPRTSCMSAPGAWGCCAARRRWARWPCRSC
jgi:hypothetical protein